MIRHMQTPFETVHTTWTDFVKWVDGSVGGPIAWSEQCQGDQDYQKKEAGQYGHTDYSPGQGGYSLLHELDDRGFPARTAAPNCSRAVTAINTAATRTSAPEVSSRADQSCTVTRWA